MNCQSYRLTARVVVQYRADVPRDPPEGFTIGLLTSPPNQEGGNFEEIAAPEYCRQPLVFSDVSRGVVIGKTLRNSNWVSFGPALSWPNATHGAVFDAAGTLLAYGYLQTAPGHTLTDEVNFAPSVIQLRFE